MFFSANIKDFKIEFTFTTELKKLETEVLLTLLNPNYNGFHVMILTETKIDVSFPNSQFIIGYSSPFRYDRKST